MNHRRLGSAGMQVSEIALGNWITHGSQIGDDTARACVHAALDCGIVFFDTADVYARGKAEAVLGNILDGIERSQYVLATKVFHPMGDGPNDQGLSRKHIIESCHASLKRLRTDHVDLYQAHRFDHGTPLEETLRAFDDLVRQGKVHYIGVSEWNETQISEALTIADEMGLDRIVSSQPQYSMLWRVPEAEVIPLCRREGIGQVVWSPLAMGVLSGKYEPGSEHAKDTRAGRGSGVAREFLEDHVLEAVQRLKPLAVDAGMSLATMAIAWVLQNDNVSAAIMGASRPEQVYENAKASGVSLEKDLLQEIDRILEPVAKTDPALTVG